MLSARLVVTLLLSQYVRSHVVKDDPTSQCVWWHDSTLITFQQHADGNPETPGETEFAAITAAFATWGRQLDACGSLHFEEGPRATSRQVKNDQTRLVLFRQVDCNDVMPACNDPSQCGNERDCWEHANGALAITSTFYDVTSGQMMDADIEFNTPQFIFTTVDAPVCVAPNFNVGCVATDVQDTATHEIGHLLGLGHSPAASSTMNARAVPGELNKRVLDDDSKKFVCDVYPAGKAARSCLLPAYDGWCCAPRPWSMARWPTIRCRCSRTRRCARSRMAA